MQSGERQDSGSAEDGAWSRANPTCRKQCRRVGGTRNQKALAGGRRYRQALFRWPIREEVDRSKPGRRWEEESVGPKIGATWRRPCCVLDNLSGAGAPCTILHACPVYVAEQHGWRCLGSKSGWVIPPGPISPESRPAAGRYSPSHRAWSRPLQASC